MSDLTFNKIAGGVLAAGLAIFGLREVSGMVFDKHPVEKPGYAVAIVEDGGGAAAEEVAPDWGTVIPIANIEIGKAVSAKCTSCHTFDAGGANGIGPNLHDVFGRRSASHAGFEYSEAMAGHNVTWDYLELNDFLRAPATEVRGTKMAFAGLRNDEERVAMIAYLRSISPNNVPLPAPLPEAAPAEDAAAPAEGEAAPG